MPAKGHSNRQKTALDTEIAQLVIAFERDLYKYVDTVIPKKRKYSLVAACEARAMMARDLIIEGLDYDINLYSMEKHRLLTEARAKLRSLTVDLQRRLILTSSLMIFRLISLRYLTRFPNG